MPLTLAEVEELRAESFADDMDIDMSRMALWSEDEAREYFLSGGENEPAACAPQKKFPPIAPPMKVSEPRSFADFDAVHMKPSKGDVFGLKIPFSAQMLKESGSAWLTTAFQTFGSISIQNSVTIIDIKPFYGGGAASKALLTVRYGLPDEEAADGPLQEKLFVKLPHPEDRKREKYLNACIYKGEGPEVAFAQRFYRRVPFKVPRTYFADRCDETTNFIIITEALNFSNLEQHPRGVRAALPPLQLERAHSKFHDHYLGTDPIEYYLVLMRKLGELAGWYKSDAAVAAEINRTFPTVYHNPIMGGSSGGASTKMVTMQLDGLERFVTNLAARLFPPDVADPKSFASFRVQFVHVVELADRFAAHLASDALYFAFGHQNLNIDNAYWWRDANGTLDAGLLDWANCAVTEVCQSLDSGLFSAGWGVLEKHKAALLSTFADAYENAGGPALPVAELELRLDMQLALSLTGQLGVPSQLYKSIKADQWPSVLSMSDDRVDGDTDAAFLMRAYLGNLIYRLTRWKRDGAYQKLCRWANVQPKPGAL